MTTTYTLECFTEKELDKVVDEVAKVIPNHTMDRRLPGFGWIISPTFNNMLYSGSKKRGGVYSSIGIWIGLKCIRIRPSTKAKDIKRIQGLLRR